MALGDQGPYAGNDVFVGLLAVGPALRRGRIASIDMGPSDMGLSQG